MSILFKGNLEEGNYTLIKSTDGWVLKGETSYAGFNFADRPQGEWIEIGTISHSYKCSVCGRTLFHITVGKNHVAKYYPYCHCGARMKGADDEDNH